MFDVRDYADYMYQYPTEKDIAFALDWGWPREIAERGFDIVDFDGTGLLEIEAIGDAHVETETNDDKAAIEAVVSGFCKIIPVYELPDPFIINGVSRRYFGWVDTPENRNNIKKWCETYNTINKETIRNQFKTMIDKKFSDFRSDYELSDFVYNTKLENEVDNALDTLIDSMVKYMQYQFDVQGVSA